MTSFDGLTWSFKSQYSNIYASVTFGIDRFIAVGDHIIYTEDSSLDKWDEAISIPTELISDYFHLNCIGFGNNKFIAFSSFHTNINTKNMAIISEDGKYWSYTG